MLKEHVQNHQMSTCGLKTFVWGALLTGGTICCNSQVLPKWNSYAENLLDTQIPESCYRPTESEILGVAPSNLF